MATATPTVEVDRHGQTWWVELTPVQPGALLVRALMALGYTQHDAARIVDRAPGRYDSQSAATLAGVLALTIDEGTDVTHAGRTAPMLPETTNSRVWWVPELCRTHDAWCQPGQSTCWVCEHPDDDGVPVDGSVDDDGMWRSR